MPTRQRAMSDQQKAARRQRILQAALDLFRESSYDNLNVASVAQRAGIAKGTVYLYFRSKEEIFLALYERELGDWFDDLDQGLSTTPGKGSLGGFIELVGASIERRPLLTRLIAIVHTVLEHNIDDEVALESRRMLNERIHATGEKVEAFLPFLRPGEGAALLFRLHALIIGYQHLAEPAPAAARALQDPDLAMLRVDQPGFLFPTLGYLLMGMAYEAKYRGQKQATTPG
ncbi:MAG: TetR family transcriptional regulator [Gammaproteobacteria bacterium]|jgi:AcrR family transcriptional regulator